MNKAGNTQVATKADIQRLEQAMKKFALKTELKQVEKNLRGEILRVEERLESKIDSVEEKLGAKLDKVMNTLDGFVKVVDDLRTENEVGAHQVRELDVRVTKLESSSHAA